MKPQHRPQGMGPLAELRIKAGLTQGELAKKAGVSKAQVRNIEHGRTATTFGRARRMARALGVSLDAVLLAVASCVEAEKPKARRRVRAA